MSTCFLDLLQSNTDPFGTGQKISSGWNFWLENDFLSCFQNVTFFFGDDRIDVVFVFWQQVFQSFILSFAYALWYLVTDSTVENAFLLHWSAEEMLFSLRSQGAKSYLRLCIGCYWWSSIFRSKTCIIGSPKRHRHAFWSYWEAMWISLTRVENFHPHQLVDEKEKNTSLSDFFDFFWVEVAKTYLLRCQINVSRMPLVSSERAATLYTRFEYLNRVSTCLECGRLSFSASMSVGYIMCRSVRRLGLG